MAAQERILNDAHTVLSSSITSGATSLTVADASRFPTEGVFRIRIDDEILEVTAVSGTTFTVVRATDGTTASNHIGGSQIAAIVTRDGINRMLTEYIDSYVPERNPYRIVNASDVILTSSDWTEDDADNTMTIIDDSNGSITLQHAAFVTSEKIAGILRNTPTAPYTITGAFRITSISDTGSSGGIFGPYIRRSANDNRIIWRYRPHGPEDQKWRASHYIGNAFQGGVGSFRRVDDSPASIHWFKIIDNNTNIEYHWSDDGVNFERIYNQSRTSTIGGAPDQVGLAIDNLTNRTAFITLLAWQES